MRELNMNEIGLRIKKRRSELFMTQQQLAEKLDVSVKFVVDIEHGLKGMSLSTLNKLSFILETSTDSILYGDKPSSFADIEAIASMLKHCPEDKLHYLTHIIRLFVAAMDKEQHFRDE